MRMSQLFLRTLRDDPADADVDSHRLLVRGGYIRKIASGIYAWLPLGRRVLRNVEAIVREEMDNAGAQEVTLPIAQPLELWEKSGRDKAYGPLMFRLQDRKEAAFCLSPTAEEVVTSLVAGEYSSYRDLPVNLYQINWKYRDELRPRFGLLRGREFLMKDAYSFDLDEDGLRASYQTMYDAYTRVFTRCALTFRPVEGDAGEIGGDINHEFMAVAAVGEDDFVWCRKCDYAANVEVATRRAGAVSSDAERAGAPAASEVSTPGLGGIDGVADFLGEDPGRLLKTIAFAIAVDGGADEVGLALVPGDREVNEFALGRALAPKKIRLFEPEDFAKHPALPKGFIGPHAPGIAVVVADPAVGERASWISGANRVDTHARDLAPTRDFTVDVWTPLVLIKTGDTCPNCGEPLSVDRGIEVGQVFQLGTKYSEALGALYIDENGEQHPMVMGCYGIGVSRVVAAIVEEHHDENGMAWPAAIAPYDVHFVRLPGKGEPAAEVIETADRLYAELTAAGISVLYDDRDASPGVKFKDADLLGMPIQLTLGAKGLARGVVERKIRKTGDRDDLTVDEVVAAMVAAVPRR
jgi:prolyl-tRNA synthetase